MSKNIYTINSSQLFDLNQWKNIYVHNWKKVIELRNISNIK